MHRPIALRTDEASTQTVKLSARLQVCTYGTRLALLMEALTHYHTFIHHE